MGANSDAPAPVDANASAARGGDEGSETCQWHVSPKNAAPVARPGDAGEFRDVAEILGEDNTKYGGVTTCELERFFSIEAISSDENDELFP